MFPNDPEGAILKEADYFPLIKQKEHFLNLCYSSGLQDLRLNSKAGKVGGAISKALGLGINDPLKRAEYARIGGKASWNKKASKEFVYWASSEGRKTRSSKGGKNGNFSNQYIQRKYNVSEEEARVIHRQKQSARGKKGGIKNRGFRWINDGVKSYKYTKKQQDVESVEDYVKRKNYKLGRI